MRHAARIVPPLLLLFLGAAAAGESDVQWGTSLDEALKRSRSTKKPVMALFWAEW
jgi:hypothetical protein